MTRMLYEELFYWVVIIKNTAEKVETKDTGQYYDIFMVKDVRGEVFMMSISLDTTASKVYGVHTTVIYIWDKEAKVVYIRKNSWDQCKFEDPDHRMVTTMTLIVRYDYISVDHTGKKMFYGSKDKIVEKFKVRLCKLNYIAVDHNGKKMSKFKDKIGEKYNVRLCRFDNISGKQEFSRVDQYRLNNISVDHQGEKG